MQECFGPEREIPIEDRQIPNRPVQSQSTIKVPSTRSTPRPGAGVILLEFGGEKV